MNYQQTLDYLFAKLPMYSRIGAAAFKPDLTNTIALCEALDNPHTKFRSIHVAGTNGKGSTSHMLAAVLQTAGYKTGLYTSPHLKDFRERIKIDGEMITENFVTRFVEKIEPLIKKLEPSFFEITVAMAFDYFADQRIDIAVIEVGLGGRLDSTNIINPVLSVITNIGWDHMNLLGNSLEKIAGEKAGIIKAGVPIVIGEAGASTLPVFMAKAEQEQAPLTVATENWYVSDWHSQPHALDLTVANKRNDERTRFLLDLQGIYQLKNIVTVMESLRLLQELGWQLPANAILTGLQHTRKLTGLHGRWEIIKHQPLVVLDVGHNEDGIRQVTRQLEVTDHENLHIIIGLVKDKEATRILSIMPKQASYYFTRAAIPRALPEDQLMMQANEWQLRGKQYANVNLALEAALTVAGKRDLVVICGSVFIVGEVAQQ